MKNETKKLAKWEAPKLDNVDLELLDVNNNFFAGTDVLMFGLSTSMS